MRYASWVLFLATARICAEKVIAESNCTIRIKENGKEVAIKLKEYECVEVKHHRDIGNTIREWQKNGWRIHTYQAAGMGSGPMSFTINHYLLFEKGE